MPVTHRLYAKFSSEAGHYVYDTASNQILKVRPDLWAALEGLLGAIDAGQPGRPSDVAYGELVRSLAQGWLAEPAITSMDLPFGETELRSALETRLQHMTLELTQRCNSRCHYCPSVCDPADHTRPQDMSWLTAQNAVDLFMTHSAETNNRAISFWGGEPLLAFPLMCQITEHVAACYPALSVRYQFTTNGTLFSPDVISFLVAHGIGVTVSVDGPEMVHNRHRVDQASVGTFKAVREGLRAIRERSPDYYSKRVRFHAVLTPGTDLNSVATFFDETDLFAGHPVTFQRVGAPPAFVRMHGAFGQEDDTRLREAMRAALIAIRGAPSTPLQLAGAKGLLRIATRPRRAVGRSVHPNGCCVPLINRMLVTTSGAIQLCERIDYRNSVGNVNSTGIAVDSVIELVREYREHSIEDCRACWAVRLCPACYRDFLLAGKWAPRNRTTACDRLRQAVRASLADYIEVIERNPKAFTYLGEESAAQQS